jgi:hypothetical protein
MVAMHNHDEDLVSRYVVPDRRYLSLLFGKATGMRKPEHVGFRRALATEARYVTDQELDRLLDDDWRAQVTAAWLAGLTHRTHYRQRFGRLLLESRRTYAGQGFCFALTRFGTRQDARVLVDYLERYLPRTDLRYDQPWALGALLYLDTRLGTREGDRFLGGLWQGWAKPDELSPEILRTIVSDTCAFADDCMRIQPEPEH